MTFLVGLFGVALIAVMAWAVVFVGTWGEDENMEADSRNSDKRGDCGSSPDGTHADMDTDIKE